LVTSFSQKPTTKMLRGVAVIQLVRSRPLHALQAAAQPKQSFLKAAELQKQQGTSATTEYNEKRDVEVAEKK
jgi:hypothetical protein